jgi:hypothetical protein
MKSRVQGRAKMRRLLAMLGVERARAPLKSIKYPISCVVTDDCGKQIGEFEFEFELAWVSHTAKVAL